MQNHIYFNNAAGAYPLASGVTEAVIRELESPPRVSGRSSPASDPLRQCRDRLAQLLDVGSSNTVLTSGATLGLNIAVLGLGLKRGDLVITSVMEHNSVLRMLARLEENCGIVLKTVPLTSDFCLDEEEWGNLLAKKPRLAVLTHASNVTGRVNPIRRMFEKAGASGAITLLDASQTVGRMPVKPLELFADMVSFSGHKGLRGPMGTGCLYVSPYVSLDPVIVGGTDARDKSRLQPLDMPMRLEAGTTNTPAFAGLSAAIEYNTEHTADIYEKEAALTSRLLEGLLDIPSVRVFDTNPRDRLPVISFTVKGMDCEEVGCALGKGFGITCLEGLHCAPLMHEALGVSGTVRFSPSYENSDEDIEYALEALRRIAQRKL